MKIVGWIDGLTDGLTDLEELALGTDAKNYDTDGDGLTDYEEITGVNSPVLIWTPREWKWINNRWQYVGGYVATWQIIPTNATNSDTDADGLTDYEEVMGLKNLHPTNPTINDTDDDHLLDSAELYSVSKKVGAKQEIKSGAQEFTFRFPDAQKASNAQLTVSISSGECKAAGEFDYQVYLNDQFLYSLDTSIINNSYYVNITDVREIVEEVYSAGYGGTWKLVVTSNYSCMLEDFKLEASVYLNPWNEDTDGDTLMDGAELDPALNNGWITSPIEYDTDGDGYRDSIEINSLNPLLRDTDGDGYIDSNDIAPRHDLYIEVEVVSVAANWGAYSHFQVAATLDGRLNYQSFVTAPKDSKTFGYKYYFDIPDYQKSFRFDSLRLYGLYPSGRGDKIGEFTVYNVDFSTYLGHSHLRTFEYVGKINDPNDYTSVTLRITSVGIQRINTIPIFENTTEGFEYGKYPEQQKMAVVLLDVNKKPGESFTSGEIAEINASPFNFGMNAIVIPSEIFLNSKLHSHVEKAVSDFGFVDWGSMPDSLKSEMVEVSYTNSEGNEVIELVNTVEITGLDRSNPGDTASEWLELLISKKYCSIGDAYDILELVLTSVINETTGEEAQVYLYNSSKQDT